MRRVLVTAAILAIAAPATAQYHQGAGYPMPGPGAVPPHPGGMMPPSPGTVHGSMSMQRADRWGGVIGGRWYAGVTAPGGWSSYHRMHRGSHLSPYWLSPAFTIDDWAVYGLGAPPPGFYWTRYYDDAVLIDGNGYVWDTSDNLDWSRYSSESSSYDESYSESGVDVGEGYAPRMHPPRIGYGEVATSHIYVSPGTTTYVTVSPSVTTTTTTTTTTDYVEEVARPRRIVRRRCPCAPPPPPPCRPVHRWKPAPRIMGS